MAYMFVPDEIAGKLELINDVCKIKNEDINKIIDNMSKEESYMTDALQENSLRFKLFAKDIAKGYKDAVSNEVEYLEEIWEECNLKRNEIYDKTNAIKKNVESTKDEIKSLKMALDDLDIYGMDRILQLIERFNNMSENDKELLIKLAEVSSK